MGESNIAKMAWYDENRRNRITELYIRIDRIEWSLIVFIFVSIFLPIGCSFILSMAYNSYIPSCNHSKDLLLSYQWILFFSIICDQLILVFQLFDLNGKVRATTAGKMYPVNLFAWNDFKKNYLTENFKNNDSKFSHKNVFNPLSHIHKS